MKRIIAVLLVLAVFFALGAISVNAETDVEALENEFFEFCDSNVKSSYEGDSVKIYDYVESDEKVFFYAQCDWIFMHQSISKVESLDEWYFISGVRENGMSGLDVYVKADGIIYPLETAFENGIVTDLTPASELQGTMFCRIGDVNGDNMLNIRDATNLQKHLAKDSADTITNDILQQKVFDMDKDGAVNIKDATAIQKKLANLI